MNNRLYLGEMLHTDNRERHMPLQSHRGKLIVGGIILIIVVSIISIFAVIMVQNPIHNLTIVNRTDQILTIHIERGRDVIWNLFQEDPIIEPNGQLKLDIAIRKYYKWFIEARDPKGSVIHSKLYMKNDFDDIEWELIISTK